MSATIDLARTYYLESAHNPEVRLGVLAELGAESVPLFFVGSKVAQIELKGSDAACDVENYYTFKTPDGVHSLRSRGDVAWAHTEGAADEVCFRPVSGVSGAADTVSLESKLRPNYFLCLSGERDARFRNFIGTPTAEDLDRASFKLIDISTVTDEVAGEYPEEYTIASSWVSALENVGKMSSGGWGDLSTADQGVSVIALFMIIIAASFVIAVIAMFVRAGKGMMRKRR